MADLVKLIMDITTLQDRSPNASRVEALANKKNEAIYAKLGLGNSQ